MGIESKESFAACCVLRSRLTIRVDSWPFTSWLDGWVPSQPRYCLPEAQDLLDPCWLAHLLNLPLCTSQPRTTTERFTSVICQIGESFFISDTRNSILTLPHGNVLSLSLPIPSVPGLEDLTALSVQGSLISKADIYLRHKKVCPVSMEWMSPPNEYVEIYLPRWWCEELESVGGEEVMRQSPHDGIYKDLTKTPKSPLAPSSMRGHRRR